MSITCFKWFVIINIIYYVSLGVSANGNAQTFVDTCKSLNGYVYKNFCYYIMFGDLTWNGAMDSCVKDTVNNFSQMVLFPQLALFYYPNMVDVLNYLIKTSSAKLNGQNALWIGTKSFCKNTQIDETCFYWVDKSSVAFIPVTKIYNASLLGIAFQEQNQIMPANKTCVYYKAPKFLAMDYCDVVNPEVSAYVCEKMFDWKREEIEVLNKTTPIDLVEYYGELIQLDVALNGASVVYNNRCFFLYDNECGPLANLVHFDDVDEFTQVTKALLPTSGIDAAWTGMNTFCPNDKNLDSYQWSFNKTHVFDKSVNQELSSVTNFSLINGLNCVFVQNGVLYNSICNPALLQYTICEWNCADPTYAGINFIPASLCRHNGTTTRFPSTIFKALTSSKTEQMSSASTIPQSGSSFLESMNMFTLTLPNDKFLSSTYFNQQASEQSSLPKLTTEKILEVCIVGDWSNFSTCSASCGEKVFQQRTRLVKQTGRTCPLLLTDTTPCNIPPCNPMSPVQQKIANAVQTLGCVWLIGIISVSLTLSIVFWSMKITAVLHASEELCLLLAHIIIAYARSMTKQVLLCTWVGIGLQYLFLVNFVCLTLESIHVFAIITSVVDTESFYSLKANLCFAWGLPIVIVLATTATSYHEYVSKFSCWLNIGNTISAATVFPVIFCCFFSIVLLESTGQYHMMNAQITEKANIDSAKIIQRGLLFIIPFNFAAWITGVLAIYEQNLGLFTSVFGLNLALGISIGFFHLCSNEKGRSLVNKIWRKVSCCRKT